MAITTNYSWPLPDKEGIQQAEIGKIAAALSSADGKVKTIDGALAAQIAVFNAHTHTFASLTGKPTTLAGYGIADAYTKTATDAAIAAAKDDILGGAGAAFDTLKEFQTALGDDPNFATSISVTIGGKLAKDQNLNDLPDKATARANLGADAAYLGKAAKAADSAKLNGQAASYYTDIAARLGFTPADTANLAALIAKLASTTPGQGAATVGVEAIAGAAGASVQAVLASLQANINAIPAPKTPDYAAGNAALSAKGVGTYALATQGNGGATATGATTAGSNLKLATGADAAGTGSSLSGTWRNMAASSSSVVATLFLRIA